MTLRARTADQASGRRSPSITRWAARDSNGTILRGLGMQLAAVDDRTFTLTLKEPWGLVLDSLAKDGSYAAFVMREQRSEEHTSELQSH